MREYKDVEDEVNDDEDHSNIANGTSLCLFKGKSSL